MPGLKGSAASFVSCTATTETLQSLMRTFSCSELERIPRQFHWAIDILGFYLFPFRGLAELPDKFVGLDKVGLEESLFPTFLLYFPPFLLSLM